MPTAPPSPFAPSSQILTLPSPIVVSGGPSSNPGASVSAVTHSAPLIPRRAPPPTISASALSAFSSLVDDSVLDSATSGTGAAIKPRDASTGTPRSSRRAKIDIVVGSPGIHAGDDLWWKQAHHRPMSSPAGSYTTGSPLDLISSSSRSPQAASPFQVEQGSEPSFEAQKGPFEANETESSEFQRKESTPFTPPRPRAASFVVHKPSKSLAKSLRGILTNTRKHSSNTSSNTSSSASSPDRSRSFRMPISHPLQAAPLAVEHLGGHYDPLYERDPLIEGWGLHQHDDEEVALTPPSVLSAVMSSQRNRQRLATEFPEGTLHELEGIVDGFPTPPSVLPSPRFTCEEPQEDSKKKKKKKSLKRKTIKLKRSKSSSKHVRLSPLSRATSSGSEPITIFAASASALQTSSVLSNSTSCLAAGGPLPHFRSGELRKSRSSEEIRGRDEVVVVQRMKNLELGPIDDGSAGSTSSSSTGENEDALDYQGRISIRQGTFESFGNDADVEGDENE
ncbi:hypothetical protein BJ742DRAFT_737311 [Cladochytrium replicatum]|nr:hypothetical protein BJ742DRAFT_737311 [Cladochytrium replicatum]